MCELTDDLEAAQSRLSFHLRVLKEAGLVTDRREGRWMYYTLNTDTLADVTELVEALIAAMPERYRALVVLAAGTGRDGYEGGTDLDNPSWASLVAGIGRVIDLGSERGLAVAQGEKADPVGTWKCEYKIGDQQRTSELTIKKDGDKLAGTMSWPDQKETNLKDLKLKGGDLTFSAVRVFMENKIPIEYKLTITGDKLKGKGASEFGGKKQEFDIEGKREKKDK